jgi:hypothetical protein
MAAVPLADRLEFLWARAWNVSIRRGQGDFVLSTSTDIVLSDAMVEFLASRQLDAGLIYRTDRYDVAREVFEIDSLDERLAFAERNIVEVHGQDGSMDFPVYGRQIHSNAAGDFLLMTPESWRTVRGIPEEVEYHSAKFDSIVCYAAHAAGIKQEVLNDPLRIYHASHGLSEWKASDHRLVEAAKRLRFARGRMPWLSALVRRVIPPRSRIQAGGVPQISRPEYRRLVMDILEGRRPYAYNDENWGMGDRELPETMTVAAGPTP